MKKNNLLKKIQINPDLELFFYDRSNRYFGDYNRLVIDVEAQVFSADGPVRLRYQHPLTRMGVAGDTLDENRQVLLNQYLATAKPYLQRPDFVKKLLANLNLSDKIWRLID